MVEAWSADVGQGKDTAMFAWRRANVAELNRLAREKMAAEGRLGGPELEARGGARYAAGDRIVTLAPGRDGQVVTSERGLVFLVDQEAQRLVAKMDDGREQVFERDEIGATQLAYGYATTVHRSQGATTGRAHVYEDGGGRELAYVAMSRAKEHTHVYVAADDLDVAREDLERAWQRERRWRWAIDTGTPEINGPEINGRRSERESLHSLRRQALVAERATYKAAFPVDLSEERRQATSERAAAVRQLERLRLDQGRTAGGELGQAAGELFVARQHRLANERASHDKDLSRKFRRGARHFAEAAAHKERAAEEKVAGLFASEERRLTDALERSRAKARCPGRKGRRAGPLDREAPRGAGPLEGDRRRDLRHRQGDGPRAPGGGQRAVSSARTLTHPGAFPVPRLQPGYRAAGPRFRTRSLTPSRSSSGAPVVCSGDAPGKDLESALRDEGVDDLTGDLLVGFGEFCEFCEPVPELAEVVTL